VKQEGIEISILEGCKKNDPTFQRKLYELHAGRMFSICLRYCNNRQEAEDMLQNGFIKVFSKINDYRGEGAFEGWLKRVFINTSLSALRMRQIKFVDSIDNYMNESSVEPTVIDKITNDEVHQLITTLPAGYKLIFNLHAIEGYDYKEISSMLQIGESTVRSQYLKARNSLKEKIRVKSLIAIHNG
jgi:RNA polymerase sigma-70 factor (ECF subfamily)